MVFDSPSLSYANPVWDGYLADPFVFRHEGVYYAVGTGPSPEPGREIPIVRSSDLVSWELLGAALIQPEVAGTHFWAPEVAFHNGRFYMYYSVGVADRGHQLRVAISDDPTGPYRDIGLPVLDPATAPFAIDASPFQDRDGRWFLFYARDFLTTDNGFRAGTGLVVAPLLDMVRIPSEFTTVMRARHDWQRYESDRKMYGGVYDWHTLEGPCTVLHEGRYYCLYSGGNWQNESYGLDFVVADSVLGPWKDTNPGVSARVLRSVPGQVLGPGHNSIVAAPDGSELLAYHAWLPSMDRRQMFLDRLSWTDEGPIGLGPTSRSP